MTANSDAPEWDLASLGLDRALARLDNALVQPPRSYEHLIPLLEALSWLYALDQLEKRRLTPSGFRALCGTADDGRTHSALIWARGKMHHNMLDLGVIRSASTDPGTGVAWVHSSNILRWAEQRDSVPDKFSRADDYDRLVSGHALSEPLRRAQQFMAQRLPASAAAEH